MKTGMFLLMTLFSSTLFTQKTDFWSGDYAIKSADLTPIDTFRIAKIENVLPEKISASLALDLNRWNILSKNDGYKKSIEARNFFYDTKEKVDEYKQFGWTKLFLKGKMKCLDAGHIFLCQTTPNTKIEVDNEEGFFTESGIFGVRLHYGLIKLEKMKD